MKTISSQCCCDAKRAARLCFLRDEGSAQPVWTASDTEDQPSLDHRSSSCSRSDCCAHRVAVLRAPDIVQDSLGRSHPA